MGSGTCRCCASCVWFCTGSFVKLPGRRRDIAGLVKLLAKEMELLVGLGDSQRPSRPAGRQHMTQSRRPDHNVLLASKYLLFHDCVHARVFVTLAPNV